MKNTIYIIISTLINVYKAYYHYNSKYNYINELQMYKV